MKIVIYLLVCSILLLLLFTNNESFAHLPGHYSQSEDYEFTKYATIDE